MNKLHLSEYAQTDLAEIKAYITDELENPSAAENTVRRITKDMRILREHALAGSSLSTIADTESDYRFLVSGNYLTFYRVSGSDVYIDRVLYGRRDYLSILLDKKREFVDEKTVRAKTFVIEELLKKATCTSEKSL